MYTIIRPANTGHKTSIAQRCSFCNLNDKLWANACFCGSDFSGDANNQFASAANSNLIVSDDTFVGSFDGKAAFPTNVIDVAMGLDKKKNCSRLFAPDGFAALSYDEFIGLLKTGAYFTSTNGAIINSACITGNIFAKVSEDDADILTFKYNKFIGIGRWLQGSLQLIQVFAKCNILESPWILTSIPFVMIEGMIDFPSTYVSPVFSAKPSSKLQTKVKEALLGSISSSVVKEYQEKDSLYSDIIKSNSAKSGLLRKLLNDPSLTEKSIVADLDPLSAKSDVEVFHYLDDDFSLHLHHGSYLQYVFTTEGFWFLDSLSCLLFSKSSFYLPGGLNGDLVHSLYGNTYKHGVLLYAPMGNASNDPLSNYDLEPAVNGDITITSVTNPDGDGTAVEYIYSYTERLRGRNVIKNFLDSINTCDGLSSWVELTFSHTDALSYLSAFESSQSIIEFEPIGFKTSLVQEKGSSKLNELMSIRIPKKSCFNFKLHNQNVIGDSNLNERKDEFNTSSK